MPDIMFPSVDEVFSPRMEALVCDLVLGDARHGLNPEDLSSPAQPKGRAERTEPQKNVV
ncbi:hypothetical protein KIH74_14970 [Kineosporia sp. J2-2]|uniref:Uncharacterized protein n=1 Tax=Kineosporia corallincola TaxID=2835133 RepID=A0ABS5TGN5_9ACTN|nr:hypothetical protein [Kineosporia corallincola]MBT0770241.1 hypothetical protein [Kineosporia corallincola]